MQSFKEYTGKEFNEIMKDKKFYKFTKDHEIHNGFQFTTGLNINNEKYSALLSCQAGLYFSDLENAHKWVQGHTYYRIVIIPDNARVSFERDKYKADRFILGERQLIESCNEITEYLASQLIPRFLKYATNLTDEMKMSMIRNDPYNLFYIEDQTEELCLFAINMNPRIFNVIKEQTPLLCFEAVKGYARNLQYVKQQTLKICSEAVKRDWYCLKYAKFQTPEMCLNVVKQDGMMLQYVKDQTEEICLEALRQNTNALQYVHEQTPAMIALVMKERKLKSEEIRCKSQANTFRFITDEDGKRKITDLSSH